MIRRKGLKTTRSLQSAWTMSEACLPFCCFRALSVDGSENRQSGLAGCRRKEKKWWNFAEGFHVFMHTFES